MADTFEPTGLSRHDLMTAAEVAAMIGVPVSTVEHWGRVGVLPRTKLGRHVRFVRAHVTRTILAAETDPGGVEDDGPPSRFY